MAVCLCETYLTFKSMRVVKHTLLLTVCYVHIHADARQQYTPTHVQTQTHLNPLHNAIGLFCSLFSRGITEAG